MGKTHSGKVANQWNEKVLGFKTIIRPGKEETKRHMNEIKQRLKKLGHLSQVEVIRELNPVIRGWAHALESGSLRLEESAPMWMHLAFHEATTPEPSGYTATQRAIWYLQRCQSI